MKSKVAFCICLIALSVNVHALGWSGWTKVSEIQTGTGGNPLFILSSFGDAGTGCSKSGYIRFDSVEDQASNPGSVRSYSTLLSALMAGKEVNVYTENCSSDYPYFRSLRVRP